MGKALLQIHNLSFSYSSSPILRAVNVDIAPGEFIGIFGPNGGGKTTLLKLILGLLEPQEGTIRLFGAAPKETRHLVGYVPQVAHLDRNFPLCVLDVVLMGALSQLNWLGRYPSSLRSKAQELLDRVGLSHKARAPFGTLSGGEAQRALIARAILNAPRLLILDEPTSHIDTEGETLVLRLLTELNSTMSILMVTHDLPSLLNKTHRLLCVQTQVTCLKASEICEHFALGLYHTPFTSTQHLLPKGPTSC